MKLSIVIPAYNESVSLKKFLPELINFAKINEFEIIIVNDGSFDTTSEILNKYNGLTFLKVINHKKNRGYGGALKSGILGASSDYTITIDADGQHRLEDVSNLLMCIQNSDADMVIGCRKGQKSATLFRGIGKSIIRRFTKLFMNLPVYDMNSGMKIYKSNLAKKYIRFAPNSMAFSDIMTIVFINSNRYVLEEPIIVNERYSGTSTISYRTAFETIKEISIIAVTFFPFKFFGNIALFTFIFTAMWGLPFLIHNKGFTTGTVLGIMFSTLFLILGILAELIAQIRKDLIEFSDNRN